jgi:hypothetical protein
MEPGRVIFLSAVSNVFHNALRGSRHLFHSYRDIIKQAFEGHSRGTNELGHGNFDFFSALGASYG